MISLLNREYHVYMQESIEFDVRKMIQKKKNALPILCVCW